MAFPSTFQERLQKMEATRSQRLLLLQVEKELQFAKSQLLSKKIEDLRREECRCLLLKRRGTELACQILASKSEIDAVEARHQAAACEYRDLKREIEELEEKEKTRDEFYNARISELEEFKESTRRFLLDNLEKVQKLQDSVSQKLKSTLNLLQGKDGYINSGRIAAAETKKSELLAEKEKLEKYLISSEYFRTLLQKQLHKMFISQEKKKNKALTEDRVEN